MSIVTFEGVMGSGKTQSAVAFAKMEYDNGKRIISNVNVTFPHERLDTQYFVDHMADEELADCVMILDEAYIYLDSRSSSTKLNKLFTYFVAQTRKRGVDLYLCVHHIDTVDKRLRRAIDVRATCRFRKEDPCKNCHGEKVDPKIVDEYGYPAECQRCYGYGTGGIVSVNFFDLRAAKRTRVKLHGPKFWGLYDTRELVAVTGKQTNIKGEDL